MENIRLVPWRRTIVESVAIILSILFAFAIDASWDEFKERNQEEVFLESLLSDFTEARSRIDESISAHKRFIELAHQLLSLHGDDAPNIDPQVLEEMLSAVFFNWESLYLPSGSANALFASGDIEIIENEELREMLAAWPSVVDDANEDDILISNDVMNNLAPYLQSKIRTRNVVRISNSDAAKLIPRIESLNYDAIWGDPLFENLVTFRIVNESFAVNENDRLREAVDEIIRVLGNELDR